MRYLLLALLPAIVWTAPKQHWTTKLPGDWTVQHVTNGHLELGLAPEMGGRVMNLRMRGDAFNWVRVEQPAYLKLRLKDISPYFYGLNYGGLRDVHSTGWPGLDFNDKQYSFELQEAPLRITSAATAEGVTSHRVMTLLPETTTVRIDVTLTNTRDQYLDLMCRLNGEYNVGNGKNYTVFPDARGQLQKVEYILGREEGRGLRPAHGGWIAKVDAATESAMLIRYPADQVKRFLLWTGAGAAESAPHLGKVIPVDYFGFTGINLWQIPQETEPGGRQIFWQEHSLYHGLTMIDLVNETTLLQLAADRQVYAAGEPVLVRVGAARPSKGEPFTVEVQAFGTSRTLTFTCPTPGEAQWHEWQIPAAPDKDGEHAIRLAGFGKTAAHTIVVDSATLGKLQSRLDKARKRITALRQRGGLANTTEADMGQALLDTVRQGFDKRDLDGTAAALERLERQLDFWIKE